jgi:uncharacterized protein
VKPKVSLITLGACGLGVSLAFYRDGLGFPVHSKTDEHVMFAQALAVGARAVEHPAAAFRGGYSGYFAGPDGYLWEVAVNPLTDLT